MAALLPRVKSRLFIHANRRSTNLLEGEYAAITAGRSLDFDDLREYVAGDEVDDIDWKATARTGNPLVKRYKQTRRQDVILAVDTGRGMAAASQGGSPKRDVAILIAGALGYLSLRHGDAVGLITRSAGRMRHRPPRASEGYLETLLRTVEQETRLDADPSDPFALCTYLLRGIPNRSIVGIGSPFITSRMSRPVPSPSTRSRSATVIQSSSWRSRSPRSASSISGAGSTSSPMITTMLRFGMPRSR
jgi:uncharacterized protein (DUF58 family)